MSKFYPTVLCALAVFTSLSPAQSLQATEPADEAARLVRDLGSPSFRQREKADAELLRLGESALPALTEGLKSPDAEIRERCEKLITTIRGRIFSKQLLDFVQNGIQPTEKPLYGWQRFRKLVGDDEKSRAAFIKLYLTDPAFAKLSEDNPKGAAQEFRSRCEVLAGVIDANPPANRDIAIAGLCPQACQLVRMAPLFDSNLAAVRGLVGRFGKQQAFLDELRPVFAISARDLVNDILTDREANNEDFNAIREIYESAPGLMREEVKQQIRPVYTRAVEKMTALPADEFDSYRGKLVAAYRLFKVGQYVGLKEVVPLAVRISQSKKWDVKERAGAINQIGKYGTKKEIEPLSQLLEDRTEVSKFGQLSVNGVGYSSYLGDVALGAMVRLSGGKFSDYSLGDGPFSGAGFFGNSEAEIDVMRQNAILKWKAR